MTFLKRILTPPSFEDGVKTQQAYMLHIILWTLVCAPIPLVIYTLTVAPQNTARILVQSAFAVGASIILLIMLRRGYVRAASLIQVGGLWLFFTGSALTSNGVQGEAYLLGYSLVIVIAGILLGGIGASFFSVLSLLAGAWLMYGQARGFIYTGISNPPLTTWVVSLILFPLSAMLQNLSSLAMRNALRRARASEERYRLISRVSSDYTFSTELDSRGEMRLNWVAGAFENITGYTYDEYVAKAGWRAHLHPDDLEKDMQAMTTLQSNNKAIVEVRTYNKSRQL